MGILTRDFLIYLFFREESECIFILIILYYTETADYKA